MPCALAFDYQRELLNEGKPLTMDTFKHKWLGIVTERPRMLLEIFEHHNKQMKELIGSEFSPLTFERYTTSKKHTHDFMKWKYNVDDMNIKDMNYEFITDYEFWLKSVRKCDHNTTMKYLSNFIPFCPFCLSTWANNGNIPVIVLNKTETKSLDRKRFTALHELGHLIMNLDGHTDKQKEKYCNYFAAAMLLPEDTLYKEVGKNRSKILLPEIGPIKQQYGISIQAIAYRMKDLGVISESYFKQFMFFISQSGYKTEEPFEYKGQEQSRRFNQLLFRALGEELISMSKAASLNNQKLAEFREKNLVLA